jgi:hypothetical protein
MDPYRTLGVLRGCTRQEAKDAFRARAWRVHPDRGGEEQAFVVLDAAYKQILEELDRNPSKAVGNPALDPDSTPPAHPPHASWDADLGEFEDPPPIHRPPSPPDPEWDPEFVMLDQPRRAPMPFDPSWAPELVVLDTPPHPSKRPDARVGTASYSSWLRDLSDQNERGNSWRWSGRISAIVMTILLILIEIGCVMTWSIWLTP